MHNDIFSIKRDRVNKDDGDRGTKGSSVRRNKPKCDYRSKKEAVPENVAKGWRGALKDFLINYCEFMRIISSWIAAAMAMTKPERAAGEGNGAGKPPRILTL